MAKRVNFAGNHWLKTSPSSHKTRIDISLSIIHLSWWWKNMRLVLTQSAKPRSFIIRSWKCSCRVRWNGRQLQCNSVALNICTLPQDKHKARVCASFINITVYVDRRKQGFQINAQLKLFLWQQCEKKSLLYYYLILTWRSSQWQVPQTICLSHQALICSIFLNNRRTARLMKTSWS